MLSRFRKSGLAPVVVACVAACRLPTPDLVSGDVGPDRDLSTLETGVLDGAASEDTGATDDALDAPTQPECVCGEHEVCVGDRCEPARFAPRSPTSSTYVTSARPWLRWGLPVGIDGARVELCEDRACARSRATWDVAGAAMRVPEALAPGVYFWRLRARHGDALDAPGPVWEFVVPAGDPFSVERRRVAYLDLDGDGLEDSVRFSHGETAPDQDNFLDVTFGGAAARSQRVQLGESTSTRWLSEADVVTSAAGDLDGDGFGDVIVVMAWFHPWFNSRGAPRKESPYSYEVRVYRGGTPPLRDAPLGVEDTGIQVYLSTTSSAWPLRDVDGDGAGDAITTQRGSELDRGGTNYSHLEVAVSGGAALTFTDGAVCYAAPTFTSGDFDADGRAEVVVVQCTPYEQSGRVFGVRAGDLNAPDRPVGACPSLGRPGPDTAEALTVLDVDDDGIDDLLVGEPGRAVAPVVYYGGVGGLTASRCGEYGVDRRDAGSGDASPTDATDATDATDVAATDAPPWALPDRHSVAAGFEHVCALDARGAVWCWGYTWTGATGDGVFTRHPSPVRVAGLGPAASIWAGTRSTCAILRDNTVWCWGADFTSTARPAGLWVTPNRVAGLDGARSLFFGGSTALCALMREGSVRCLGDVSGFLGFPERYPVLTTATPVLSLGNVREINGTWLVTLLLHGDGSSEFLVRAYTAPARRIAIAPAGSSAAVSAGNGWGVIARPDGTAMLVGFDLLGDPHDRGDGPRPLPGADGVVAVSAGGLHGAALRRDGTVLRWGALEAPDDVSRYWPATPTPGLRDIVEVSAGDRAGCARAASGALYCWNMTGGLSGDGTYERRFVPVPVRL